MCAVNTVGNVCICKHIASYIVHDSEFNLVACACQSHVCSGKVINTRVSKCEFQKGMMQ